MSKGKKQALTLIVLCVLMAAGICLYLFLPQRESEENQGETTETAIKVETIEKEKITSVHITSEEQEEIFLQKDGDKWKLKDLPEASLLTETVEGMFTYLTPVTATKELASDGSNFSEYGLDDPMMVVEIATSDGKQYELKFGQEVPVSGGNYGVLGNENKIYTFSETLYNSFHIEKNTLIEKEEIVDINEDYLSGISVVNDGKETFHAQVVADDKKVDAYTNWVISKPYEKPLAGSSTDDWSKMLGYFTSVTFEDLVEYNCKDMSQYGLDKPSAKVTVDYFEVKDGYELPQETESPDGTKNTNKTNVVPEEYKNKKSYQLLFGDVTDDGSYYVCIDGSRHVYTMTASEAENKISVDAYTYMDHCVYSTLATDIKGYDVTIGGKKISVTHTTEKGDDGKDKNVWTLNGKQVTDEQEEEFLTPYSKAYLLEFTSQVKKDVKPAGKKPVMTIVYHEENRDVTVTYLPYDGTNFYKVDKDGMDYFLVDKRSVDDVISAFEALLDLDLPGKK